MLKHTVLVVHGVGEQIAGHTVDEAVAGAIAEHERNGGTAPDLSSEEFTLPESAYKPHNANTTVEHAIPLQVKRRLLTRKTDTGIPEQTLFAEVFWADRSPAPVGVLQTFADLIRNVLGIGYLALDNVQNTSRRPTQLLVLACVRVFYFFVAPLNAMLVIGGSLLIPAALVQALGFAGAKTISDIILSNFVILAAGAIAFWASLKFRRPEIDGFSLRNFWLGLRLVGGYTIFVAIGLLYFFGPQFGFESPDIFGFFIHGLFVFVLLLIIPLSVFWSLCVLLSTACYFAWLWERGRSGKNATAPLGQTRIFAPVLSGMLVLWFSIVMSFWLVFEFLLNRYSPGERFLNLFSEAIDLQSNTIVIYGIAVVLIFVVSVCLVIVRSWFKTSSSLWGFRIPRLILNWWFQVVFALSNFASAAVVVVIIASLMSLGAAPLLEKITEAFAGSRSYFIALFIVLGLAAYYAVNSLSAVLGIGRDVVSYSTVTKPLAKDTTPEHFPIRQALDIRFARVWRHVLDHHPSERITIIAHSFGSVIAVRYLQRMFQQNLLPKNVKIQLLTMGSPVSHIYGQYFCCDFALDASFPKAVAWKNFYRIGDYVGTTISDPQVPDFEIGKGGHTEYWTDSRFWAALTENAKFNLF